MSGGEESASDRGHGGVSGYGGRGRDAGYGNARGPTGGGEASDARGAKLQKEGA